jgi:hypothetical protein
MWRDSPALQCSCCWLAACQGPATCWQHHVRSAPACCPGLHLNMHATWHMHAACILDCRQTLQPESSKVHKASCLAAGPTRLGHAVSWTAGQGVDCQQAPVCADPFICLQANVRTLGAPCLLVSHQHKPCHATSMGRLLTVAGAWLHPAAAPQATAGAPAAPLLPELPLPPLPSWCSALPSSPPSCRRLHTAWHPPCWLQHVTGRVS